MKWEVTWEYYVFDKLAQPVAVHDGRGFTVKAYAFDKAVERAEREIPRVFSRMRKEHPDYYSKSFDYMFNLISLKDKNDHYYKLSDAHEVFGNQIRKGDDYGSPE